MDWKPPQGCTQYFTGTTGRFCTINYTYVPSQSPKGRCKNKIIKKNKIIAGSLKPYPPLAFWPSAFFFELLDDYNTFDYVGHVYSYNYQGGVHLANQEYTNCIRQEEGYCKNSYATSSTSFKVFGQNCYLEEEHEEVVSSFWSFFKGFNELSRSLHTHLYTSTNKYV